MLRAKRAGLWKTETERRCIILMPGQMERWCPPADPATETGQIISIPDIPFRRSVRVARCGQVVDCTAA